MQSAGHPADWAGSGTTGKERGKDEAGKETGVSGYLRPKHCRGRIWSWQAQLWAQPHHGAPAGNFLLCHRHCFAVHEPGKETAVSFALIFANLVSYRPQTRLHILRACGVDSKYGDVIFATIRPYLKNICIIDRDFPYEPIVSTAFAVMHCPEGLLNKYLYYYLLSPTFMSFANAIDKAKGVAYPAIGEKDFFNGIIALPPIEEQQRIVAKIEELLPYVDRYATAYEKLEQFNAKFPEDMKKSILQYAIQGKLVEQRPEEGTGEELYQQIQTEKQRLIKEGKIKKEKPLPEIAEDEIPFDIPESWKWVRLSEIISVLGDGIHGTPVFDEMGDYYFVNGNNLAKGHIVFKADTKKVSFDEYEKHKKPLDENTILISINGTIGNYAFYAGEPIILGKSACYFSVLAGVDKEYVRHLINTKFFMDYAVKEATQTTIKNVSLKAMRMLPVPLPPLAEQKRIVAKLEEILPLCERLK